MGTTTYSLQFLRSSKGKWQTWDGTFTDLDAAKTTADGLVKVRVATACRITAIVYEVAAQVAAPTPTFSELAEATK